MPSPEGVAAGDGAVAAEEGADGSGRSGGFGVDGRVDIGRGSAFGGGASSVAVSAPARVSRETMLSSSLAS